ncbi:hypothetical protein RUND412_008238, partial [Rhizina undulata]
SSFYAIIDHGDEDIVMTVDEAKTKHNSVQVVAAPSNKSDDSETAVAHSRRKLVPIDGGMKPLRALRSPNYRCLTSSASTAAKGSKGFQASVSGNEFATGMRKGSFRVVDLVGGAATN